MQGNQDFGTVNELFVYFWWAITFLDDMMSGTKDLHWDRIKVVCSQPYLKFNKQYGLQFIAVKTIASKKESTGTGPLLDANQNKLNNFFSAIRWECLGNDFSIIGVTDLIDLEMKFVRSSLNFMIVTKINNCFNTFWSVQFVKTGWFQRYADKMESFAAMDNPYLPGSKK